MTPEKPFKKPTICVCPTCRKKHMLKMHWIGTGIPRKYCRKCEKSSNISKLAPNTSSGQRDRHFYGVEEK